MPPRLAGPMAHARLLEKYGVAPDKPPPKKKKPSERDLMGRRYTELLHWLHHPSEVPPGVLMMPIPPNLGNTKLHYRVEQACKTAHKGFVTDMLALGFLPPPPKKPPPFARLKITLVSRKPIDRDNRHRRLKFVLDALKGAGYIQDDDDEHLDYDIIPVVCSKTPQRIEVRFMKNYPIRLRDEIKELAEAAAKGEAETFFAGAELHEYDALDSSEEKSSLVAVFPDGDRYEITVRKLGPDLT